MTPCTSMSARSNNSATQAAVQPDTVPAAAQTVLEQATTARKRKRDTEWYHEFAVVQVEDTLFRIPLDQLVHHSPILAKRFQQVDEEDDDRSVVHVELHYSDKDAFVLEDVTVPAFKALLKLLYPRELRVRSGGSIYDVPLSLRDWISIHTLARHWSMTSIQSISRTKINHLLPKEKPDTRIELGTLCCRSDEVMAGLRSLIRVNGPGITNEMAGRMGGMTAFKVMRIQSVHKRFKERDGELRVEFGAEMRRLDEALARGEGVLEDGDEE